MNELEIEKLRQIVSRTDKTGNEKVEMLIEFVEQQVKLCNKPAVMGSLPDDAKIAEVARNYFPFEKPYSTNTSGMDVNYPKQYGFMLGAKWIINTLKWQ